MRCLWRTSIWTACGSSEGLEVGGDAYPWESPEANLAAAEKLSNDCGYHRRDEELADAKVAILGTPRGT